MKTTRAKLVDFIEQKFKVGFRINSYYELADKLIESGLVEVEEEPKEFWVFEDSEGAMYMSLSEDLIKYNLNKTPKTPMVKKGKFHSVDQCKKYEKMWNELKHYTNKEGMVSCFVKMQDLEKGE